MSKLAAGLVLAASLLSSNSGRAQASVDPKTRDLLIEKLTQVYLNLAPLDSSKVPITLRLADLHAERARLDAMHELETGCTVCTAGKADRQKALSYYQEVLPKAPASSVGKILAQVGHLYEMTGNEKEAIATYERILRENKSPEASAEASLSLAEVYFKRRNYPKARENYALVLSNSTSASHGLAAYRMAWCDFNNGQLEPAIEGLVKVLKSPELLSRSANAGTIQVDKQFQEEVSHDLATFIARRKVTVQDASLVYDLSPEQEKLANVTYLASELERLGQVQASISVWRLMQEKQSKPQARLEGHVHLAQLEMEQKQLSEASKDFEAALSIWSTMGACQATDCVELKTRLKKFVIDWNRIEKKAPSENLLSAYKSYLKAFPSESDMSLWAGQVALELKQYPLAVELDTRAALLASATLGSKAEGANLKEASEHLEAGLLGAIEAAELSKDAKLLETSYESYLSMSQTKKKALEVRYQKAHLIYDRGEYALAADALKAVALSKEAGAVDVKSQAAELALDSLVLLKDDTKLEAWAAEFAGQFPKNASDFRAIARKSVLTQAAAVGSKGDPAAFEAAWATLQRFDLSSATPEDKASFYKNKLILAEKTGRFSEARDAVENLLRLPQLSPADQQYALSRKAWLAELVLDFDTALTTTQKLTGSEFSGEKKWLKLAMFAELANKDAKPFYGQFLKESKDDEKSLAIVTQLVRDSKEPLKEIEKYKAVLMKHPQVLADLDLEIFATLSKQPSGEAKALEMARKALAQNGVSGTPSGKALSRALLLEDYAKLKNKITAHQLDGSNQKKMATTLKARVQLLDETEKLVSRAVELGDWTSQLVAIDLLSKQNERFYQEVLALPMPAGLNEEEQGQYLQLLSEQAAPHQLRAKDTAKKVDEFWQNEKAISELEKTVDAQTGAMRALFVREISVLASVAPDNKKTALEAIAVKKESEKILPQVATLEGARQAVRENPMSRKDLESLLTLEKQMGRQTMVSYLEGRLQILGEQSPSQQGVGK